MIYFLDTRTLFLSILNLGRSHTHIYIYIYIYIYKTDLVKKKGHFLDQKGSNFNQEEVRGSFLFVLLVGNLGSN